jgi:hypothetical protein
MLPVDEQAWPELNSERPDTDLVVVPVIDFPDEIWVPYYLLQLD